MICGTGGTPAEVVRQLATLTSCCLGAAEGGPLDCTCWHPEFVEGEDLLPANSCARSLEHP